MLTQNKFVNRTNSSMFFTHEWVFYQQIQLKFEFAGKLIR
jgi:hypothetical protein